METIKYVFEIVTMISVSTASMFYIYLTLNKIQNWSKQEKSNVELPKVKTIPFEIGDRSTAKHHVHYFENDWFVSQIGETYYKCSFPECNRSRFTKGAGNHSTQDKFTYENH